MQVHRVDVSAFIQNAHPEWATAAAGGATPSPTFSGAVLRDIDAMARAGYALDNMPSAVVDAAVARQRTLGNVGQDFPALAGLIAAGRNNATVSMSWGAAFGNPALMKRVDMPVEQSLPALFKKLDGTAEVSAKPGSIEIDCENGCKLRVESVPAGAFKPGTPLRLEWERPDIKESRTHVLFPDSADGKAMIDDLRNCLRLRVEGDEYRGHPMRQLWGALEAAEPGIMTDDKSMWLDTPRVPRGTLPAGTSFQSVTRAEDGSLQLAARKGRFSAEIPAVALTPAMALELVCGVAERADHGEFNPTTWRDEERRTWQDLLGFAATPDPHCGETVPDTALHYLKPPMMPAVPKVAHPNDIPAQYAPLVIAILQSPTLRQTIHALDSGKEGDDWTKSFILRATDNAGLTEKRLAMGLRLDPKDPNAITEYQFDGMTAKVLDDVLAQRADRGSNAVVRDVRRLLAQFIPAPASAAG